MSWAAVQQGPAFWFTVVALIVVFGPVIAERLRLPGLMGLLLGGALIGPNMLDVLPGFDTLDSVGSIGVLYLIFLAGRPGEVILVPAADAPDGILAPIIGLAGRLADPVGGILQPIVVIPSTAPERIE